MQRAALQHFHPGLPRQGASYHAGLAALPPQPEPAWQSRQHSGVHAAVGLLAAVGPFAAVGAVSTWHGLSAPTPQPLCLRPCP
eukprot:1680478-Lingulodinium_polyedra.AAC.1